MRLLKLTNWMLLGGAAALVIGNRRRRSVRMDGRDVVARRADDDPAIPDTFETDPADPIQTIEEVPGFHTETLDVEAMSQADREAVQDLAMVETEIEEEEEALARNVGGADSDVEVVAVESHDVGDLYGAHVVRAEDPEVRDGDESYDEGQNWLEALETQSAESGPEAEQDLDITDTADEPPHRTDMRDIPVADRGSAGPRGL